MLEIELDDQDNSSKNASEDRPNDDAWTPSTAPESAVLSESQRILTPKKIVAEKETKDSFFTQFEYSPDPFFYSVSPRSRNIAKSVQQGTTAALESSSINLKSDMNTETKEEVISNKLVASVTVETLQRWNVVNDTDPLSISR